MVCATVPFDRASPLEMSKRGVASSPTASSCRGALPTRDTWSPTASCPSSSTGANLLIRPVLLPAARRSLSCGQNILAIAIFNGCFRLLAFRFPSVPPGSRRSSRSSKADLGAWSLGSRPTRYRCRKSIVLVHTDSFTNRSSHALTNRHRDTVRSRDGVLVAESDRACQRSVRQDRQGEGRVHVAFTRGRR